MNIPAYLKYTIILLGLMMIFYIIIIAQSLLAPVLTALIFALLLRPVSGWMEKYKIPRGISSIVSMILIIAVLFGISYFISFQVRNISNDFNEIGSRFDDLVDKAHEMLEENFGIAEQQQTKYFKDSIKNFAQNSSQVFSSTLLATAGFFTAFVLVLLSLFFFLYYRGFLVRFLHKAIHEKHHPTVDTVLPKIEKVVRSYILGLFTVILIIAALNTIGLMIIGVEYAIFFGLLAALLTIIPYLGIFIGSLLPILYVLITKDSLWYPVGVAGIFWFVQFLEGNFITPNVIGNQVSVNPFAAIVALFIGGMVWGPIGMILSIPLVAIIKVIMDHIEPLQPYGFLLGNPPSDDTRDSYTKIKKLVKRVKQKA